MASQISDSDDPSNKSSPSSHEASAYEENNRTIHNREADGIGNKIAEKKKHFELAQLEHDFQLNEMQRAIELARLERDLKFEKSFLGQINRIFVANRRFKKYPALHDDGDNRSRIALMVIKSFIFIVFLFFLFIILGFISSALGYNANWSEGAGILLQLIQITVFPVAMLVLGFYFGRSQDKHD